MVQWVLTTSFPFLTGLGIALGEFNGTPWRLNLDLQSLAQWNPFLHQGKGVQDRPETDETSGEPLGRVGHFLLKWPSPLQTKHVCFRLLLSHTHRDSKEGFSLEEDYPMSYGGTLPPDQFAQQHSSIPHRVTSLSI